MLVIPLEVESDDEDPRQARPFLHLFVDGRPVRVLLDSGAGRTAIAAPANTPTHSIPSTGTGAFGLPGDDGQLWSTNISIGATPIGMFEIDDVPTGDGFNVGQDVLARFRCHYRLAELELILDGPDSPGPEEIYLDPAEHVYLKAQWSSGTTADVVFDTGASVTVIDAGFADEHPELITACGTSIGIDSSGAKRETPMVELKGPTILGYTFAPSLAAIVDLDAANATVPRPMNVIVGWPLISQTEWIIDHPKARACVIERT